MTDENEVAHLPPELKAKWIDALRSGRYAQARNALRDNNCFCCLGVLCDVLDPNGWNRFDDHQYGGDTSAGSLSGKLNETLIDIHKERVLIEMNDNHMCSFSEIADWVEKNL